ncbi:MAG TPA: zinc ribbon domain-containing protein [Terriglobia bacterium]|nr:zinc ribbon domain-containing protein [Terriglobia bacterium]
MNCPKCHTENPVEARFCIRCHMTLKFVCPTCQHPQDHGGTCDQCGLNFAKYAVVLEFQAQNESRKERERGKERATLARQALLAVVTGGFSLIKFVSKRLREG